MIAINDQHDMLSNIMKKVLLISTWYKTSAVDVQYYYDIDRARLRPPYHDKKNELLFSVVLTAVSLFR